MAFPLPHPQRRAPRIQLGDSISAVVLKQNGQRAKGKLFAISVTGGLLQLRQALTQGDFVEVSFQMQSGVVQGLAEMLIPARGPNDGVRQAFRFVAMGDDDHRALRVAADSASDRIQLFSSLSARKTL
jgi:hypothetical protein